MYDISVIIPSYNREKLLKETLRLLNEQTYSHDKFEVVVVDDGSNDDTEAIVKEFQNRVDYKLKYIKQKQKGPASARNKGVKEAQSDFILFIGDDIFPAKNLIEQHVRSLKEHSQAAILGFVDWSKEQKVTDFMNYVAPNGFQFRYNTIKDPNDCDFRHFYTCNISLARKWMADDRFDEDFPYGALEDSELSYRLKKKGLKIVYNNKAQGCHFHPMTMESFCHRMKLTGISAVILLKKHPELKSILLPMINIWAARIIFSVLVKIGFIRKINKKFYWYCRIVNSYLEGVEEGLKKNTLSS
ncbi:MAG: glycosyltransferase family 2 protein [Candidatus Aureabacteria bacterium]|nr:glycosyltransferase family 2 protein [Candidatus Auribacterota bacterium]